MEITIICETATPPFDEGYRNYAFMLAKKFNELGHVVKLYARTSKKFIYENIAIFPLPSNKLFLSYNFLKNLSKNNIIVYIPSSSATLPSFFRNKLLSFFCEEVIFILLQPNLSGKANATLVKYLFSSSRALVQHPLLKEQLEKFGIETKFVASGINLNKFRPANKNKKIELRNKYDLPIQKKIILHVGHINQNRNLCLLELVQSMDKQIVIVGSTSFPSYYDLELRNKLQKKKIVILSRYIENIQELYQLADCYIFPVLSERAAIGCPLSIFEAMACNLPILTTKFGILPWFFREGGGLFYFHNENELRQKLNVALTFLDIEIKTREMVKMFSWENVACKILKRIEKV